MFSSYDEDYKIKFYTFGTLVHESQVNQVTMDYNRNFIILADRSVEWCQARS